MEQVFDGGSIGGFRCADHERLNEVLVIKSLFITAKILHQQMASECVQREQFLS